MTNPVTITAPAGVPFIEIVREFDAPLEAVYNAYADPELVRQWVGPNGYETAIDAYDLTSGGRWRYVQTNPEGDSFAFNGVFHRVRPNELIIQTFEWEGLPDQVSIETLRFDDLGDGRTRLTGWSVFPSVEGRDGMVENGMEVGVTEGYERLDALLA
ncbi:SRPBCC family protein [Herbiconiux daphne]|uniref:SRPBCC family protein n=1 Tax=Herbiconiux daphne TaxID=2970914 RepID=A0ABT2H7E7_9MICO|nr:SRPBCC family protein [Herbiconiux daphne]MCS5735886.1 SRPBCC family protein [Herbiconiux daphne]